MANRMYLRSKTGEKDSEASSKKADVTVMAPLHAAEPGPALPDDLERLRLVLITDMTQAVHSALKRELEDALSPVNATMEQIMSSYELHDERIREVEDGLNDYSDRLVSAEAAIAALQSENAFLKGKLDDLENRSRRSNLRVVGIPENLEGSDPVKFMTEFFDEVLGTDFFPRPLVLSRGHRVGRKPSGVSGAKQTRPRTFLVCFHSFQDKQRIINRRKQELYFRGHRVFFYEDFSAELGKKRAAFKEVKSLLYGKGVRFGLLYPAQLRVMHEGKKHYFDTPEAAKEFYHLRWGEEEREEQ